MAGKKPRYLIKRELDRANNNLVMFGNHLLTIRTQCQVGNRPDLVKFVDMIGDGIVAIKETIDAFQLMVDGQLPVTSTEKEE